MKKNSYLLTLIIIVFNASFSFSQDTVKGGYKGCYVYKCYFYNGSFDTTNKFKNAEYLYNEKGNKIKEIQYDMYGQKSYFWKYDDNGNETEYRWVHNTGSMYYGYPGEKWIPDQDSGMTTKKYDTIGNLIEKTEYDAKGNITDKSVYKSSDELKSKAADSLAVKLNEKYDDKGNLIEKLFFYEDGSVFYKDTYEYNENGKAILNIKYKSDGSIIEKYTYKYDKKGNMTEYVYSEADGEDNRTVTYKYDDKGNKIEIVAIKADKSIAYKYAYKYNDTGTCIEEVKYRTDGSVEEKATSKKDDSGNVTEEFFTYNIDNTVRKHNKKIYNDKGILIEEEYQFIDKAQYWNSEHELLRYNNKAGLLKRLFIFLPEHFIEDRYGNMMNMEI